MADARRRTIKAVYREEVKAFLDGLRVNPMNQLQVDLADMKAFGGKPYPFMLVAIDALTKKVAAEPLKDRLASTTAAGMKKVFQALGVPANVYSDDGSEFKREFKELMDFWDIEKQVTRGHACFAERTIHTTRRPCCVAQQPERAGGGSGASCWLTS